MRPGDCPSTSITYCVDGRPCVNFCRLSVWPENLLSTLRVAGRLSVNFLQLSLRPGDLSSSSVNFPFGWETFRQLSLTFRVAGRPSFKFHHLSMRPGELPSTFLVSRKHSVNFQQLYVPLEDIVSTSVNFPCSRETFCQLFQTFHAAGRPSVNCRLLSLRSGDLLLTTSTIRAFVNIPFGPGTFC